MTNTPFDKNDSKFQWAKLKDKPLKEKISYFWTYYGLLTVGILAGLGLITWVVITIITNSGTIVLSGEFYTESLEDDNPEELLNALCEKLELDPTDCKLNLSGTYISPDSDYTNEVDYATRTRLVVRVAAYELDFWGAAESQFLQDMDPDSPDNNMCADLRTVLSEETLQKLDEQGRLRYLDTSYAGRMPYLIDIGSSVLSEMMGITEKESLICAIINSERKESFAAMIDILLQQ